MRVKILTERPMGLRIKRWLKSQGVQIVTTKPDLLIVCYYKRILKKEEFSEPPMGTINFHPGYLPWNRGMHPHIWPLIDGSPAGVTLHYITEKVDGGDIIAQKQIVVKPTYNVSDMDRITQDIIFKLFTSMWTKIKSGRAPRIKQKGKGSFHWEKDIHKNEEFNPEIIHRLRAVTYDDRTYGYFIENGKKYKVGIKFYD